MKEINFETKGNEDKLLTAIVERSFLVVNKFNPKINKLDILMDIQACHCNGNPLRLEGLLKADKYDFYHDVIGIINNIDRNTGELKNCFSPRYSA